MNKVASIRLPDLTALAWSSLRRNLLRSFLTIGAIAIGIAVMMYLISLGFGLKNLTIDSVKRSNALLSLTVNSANETILPLTSKTLTVIKKVPKVDKVFPEANLDGEIILENQHAEATVIAADSGYLESNSDIKLVTGQFYRDQDTQTMIVTTGFLKAFGLDQDKVPLVTFDLQLKGDVLGSIPAIQDINVSGIVDAPSLAIYIPRLYIESLAKDGMPPYSNITVTTKDLNDVEPVSEAIRNQGFRVTTVSDTVTEINKVFKTIEIVLGVLGAIAIGVASIGMFNTLTISLLERTKEIGIMKALGVRRNDIRRLFLMEALLMGIIGGLSGIGLAIVLQQLTLFVLSLLASIVEGKVPQLFMNQPLVVLGFLLFAILIALMTGIYPASRAMKLNPIEAIKYE